MKRFAAILTIFVFVIASAGWVLSSPKVIDAATAKAVSAPGDPEAGKIVFAAGGCESCHMTPGQPNADRLGGGMELKTPFGSFYPPNISPDRTDGIGGWSVVQFANALTQGVSPGGEHYYPAFPYASYRLMNPKDLRDLFAYMKTLPPVSRRPQRTSLSFPFNIRRGIGLWKLFFLPSKDLQNQPGRSSAWLLGRYLVEGPGHCGECHSPRNLLGGVIASKRLSGAPLLDGKGKAPALTANGLKEWTTSDIAEALSSGFTPSGDSLGGAMAAVVRNTSQLPSSYREAIAEYLKALPN